VEADAINTLEESSYYQGNWTVDDYLDSFLVLTLDTRYTDSQTLVVKFHQGLKLNIQSQIATMPFGRPADTDDGDQKVWSWNKGESKVREAKSPSCFTIVH